MFKIAAASTVEWPSANTSKISDSLGESEVNSRGTVRKIRQSDVLINSLTA